MQGADDVSSPAGTSDGPLELVQQYSPWLGLSALVVLSKLADLGIDGRLSAEDICHMISAPIRGQE